MNAQEIKQIQRIPGKWDTAEVNISNHTTNVRWILQHQDILFEVYKDPVVLYVSGKESFSFQLVEHKQLGSVNLLPTIVGVLKDRVLPTSESVTIALGPVSSMAVSLVPYTQANYSSPELALQLAVAISAHCKNAIAKTILAQACEDIKKQFTMRPYTSVRLENEIGGNVHPWVSDTAAFGADTQPYCVNTFLKELLKAPVNQKQGIECLLNYLFFIPRSKEEEELVDQYVYQCGARYLSSSEMKIAAFIEPIDKDTGLLGQLFYTPGVNLCIQNKVRTYSEIDPRNCYIQTFSVSPDRSFIEDAIYSHAKLIVTVMDFKP